MIETNSIYMTSRYTSSNNGHARHIENDNKPLCGQQLTKTGSWVRSSDNPDCEKCLELSKQIRLCRKLQ